ITSLKWLETNNLFNNLIQRNQSAAFSSGKVRPNHETNINIIARRTGKDVNSHTVLDGIITTIMATIQRINIIGSREGSRNRRRLKANQTGKKFRVGIKSNISTNRNNLISGVDRKSGSAGMPRPISYAVFCLKKKTPAFNSELTKFENFPSAIVLTATCHLLSNGLEHKLEERRISSPLSSARKVRC